MPHFHRFKRSLWLREYWGNSTEKSAHASLSQPPPLSAAVSVSGSLVPAATRSLAVTAARCKLPSTWEPPVPPSYDLKAYTGLTQNTITHAFNEIPVPLPYARNIRGRDVSELVRFLRKGSVFICLADKNAGTVAVSAAWYNAEAQRQLSDRTSYVPVPKLMATQRLSQSVQKLAGLVSALPKHEAEFILASTLKAKSTRTLPYFYLLLKMHKQPVVGRPIVSWFGYALANASIWVDAQLQPLLRLESSVLPSSNRFVQDLAAAPPIQKDCWLLSADVASLYPSMPLEAVLAALNWFLTRHARLGNFERSRIAVLTNVVTLLMQATFFTFASEVFQQILGIPMGTHCGPSVANVLLLHVLDRPLLQEFGDSVGFYRRFIDDLFARVRDRATAVRLRSWLFALAPWLKFTVTLHNCSIEFMDVRVFKPPGFSLHGTLATTIHFKPVSRHLYLPFTSFHPRHCFSGLVVGELIRAAQLCSQPYDFVQFRAQLFHWLSLRGYPAWFLAKWFARVNWSKRSEYGKSKAHTTQPLVLKVPYAPNTALMPWRRLLDASWSLLAPALGPPPTVSWTIPGQKLGAIFNMAF